MPIDKDRVIYRDCGVALTKTGKQKELAVKFVEFLRSPEGAGIFAKWGWITPTAPRALRTQKGPHVRATTASN